MSESDGLRKLTEYLAQTRRQAETAIDELNRQIVDLKKENEMCMQVVETLEAERDYFKSHAEQLKQVNSTKYRLQERDDWKSLIDSVQKDRNRLQEDCIALEHQLQQSKSEIEYLRGELQRVNEEKAQLEHQSPFSPAAAGGSSSRNRLQSDSASADSCSGDDDGSDADTAGASGGSDAGDAPLREPQLSPLIDRDGRELQLHGSTRSVVRQLKLELKYAHSQVCTPRELLPLPLMLLLQLLILLLLNSCEGLHTVCCCCLFT